MCNHLLISILRFSCIEEAIKKNCTFAHQNSLRKDYHGLLTPQGLLTTTYSLLPTTYSLRKDYHGLLTPQGLLPTTYYLLSTPPSAPKKMTKNEE